jgi:hypothetical protein
MKTVSSAQCVEAIKENVKIGSHLLIQAMRDLQQLVEKVNCGWGILWTFFT